MSFRYAVFYPGMSLLEMELNLEVKDKQRKYDYLQHGSGVSTHVVPE